MVFKECTRIGENFPIHPNNIYLFHILFEIVIPKVLRGDTILRNQLLSPTLTSPQSVAATSCNSSNAHKMSDLQLFSLHIQRYIIECT